MKKIKTIFILLLVAVLLAMVLIACGGQEPEDTPEPTPQPATSTPVADAPTEKAPAQKTAEPDATMVSEDEETETEASGEDEDGETPTPQGLGLTAEIVSGEIAGAGKPFTFDATQSETADYPIEAYGWDMGDGTTMFGLAVQHAYAEPGEYTVTLTIIDEDGERAATSKVIQIVPLEDLLTPTAVSEDPTLALIGTFWLMNNPMRGTIVTLNFDADDLSGSSGCNSYSANYTVVAADGPTTTLSVDVISGTGLTCTQEIMAQERGYLDSLGLAENYSIDDDTLILETGSGTLTFRPADQ